MHRIGRVMVIAGFLLVVSSAAVVLLVLLRSPGRGISEKTNVAVNGMNQGMFIQSRNAENPVLLFLHGGPGMPEYFLTERYPTGLEDLFTLCWWERRGAGLSYSSDIPPETMTTEQAVADTLAVTEYLRRRFGKEKIYLMGHSGGSRIGLLAAARAPELYHAYIGVGQMTYQLESERLAYEYMLNHFKAAGNVRMVRKLEAAPVVLDAPLPAYYLSIRDRVMHSLGVGTTRDMKSVVTGIFLRSWLSREYTVREKAAIWRGLKFSRAYLWEDMLRTDLRKSVRSLAVPVYFFHGKYDYTVSYPLAESYLEQLQAPVKGFYTFNHSAHSPIFEEPQAVRRILSQDVLSGTAGLAD